MNKQQRYALLLNRWQEMNAYENALRAQGVEYIAGSDEAGRGPLAGPVTAAAVILPAHCLILGLDDSKKLSEQQRLALEPEIKRTALAWACVAVDHHAIDEINILEASRLAMRRAVQQLGVVPQHVLTDAVTLPLDLPQTAIVQGDAKSVSIAAASVIAKCTRDRLMLAYDAIWPCYGFARHKGYPTPAHKEALRQYGFCPIHRRTFKF